MPGWVDTGLNVRGESPVCLQVLGNDLTMNAQTDYNTVVSWPIVANVDTHAMWKWNGGSGSYIQIPFAGRYLVHVHTVFGAFGTYDPNLGVPLSNSIMVNGTSAAFIEQEVTSQGFRFETGTFDNVMDHKVFAAGDKIYSNWWTRYGGQLRRFGTGNNRTYMMVRYLGPN